MKKLKSKASSCNLNKRFTQTPDWTWFLLTKNQVCPTCIFKLDFSKSGWVVINIKSTQVFSIIFVVLRFSLRFLLYIWRCHFSFVVYNFGRSQQAIPTLTHYLFFRQITPYFFFSFLSLSFNFLKTWHLFWFVVSCQRCRICFWSRSEVS